MKCPECKTKISTKHYDAEYGWYECPKCEGCFSPAEVEEAASGTSPEKRARKNDGRRNGVAASGGSDGRRNAAVTGGTDTKPLAKAKKKQKEIQEDLEALAKKEKEWLKPVETDEPEIKKHRDEVTTPEVVNIMATEIQLFYEELGGELDDVNARDKALTLWRQLKIDTGISAREQEVPYLACAEHA